MECSSVARYVTISAVGSSIPLTLCNVNILAENSQSTRLCGSTDQDGYLVLNGKCYLQSLRVKKLNFNDTVEFCHAQDGMSVLSNRNALGYTKIIEMENSDRKGLGRRMVWIGAQLRHRNKWHWVDQSSTGGRPWIGEKVEVQPWGLSEPSGEDCVVADSALQWGWNSIRCIISARVICEADMKKCPSPEVLEGSYIKSGKTSKKSIFA